MHVLQIWDENTVDGWIQDLSEILNRSWSLRMVSCLLDGDCSQLQLFNGFVNSTLPLFLQETHSSLLILLLIISRSGKGDWVQRALGGTESKWKVEKIIKKNDKGFGLKIRILKKKKKFVFWSIYSILSIQLTWSNQESWINSSPPPPSKRKAKTDQIFIQLWLRWSESLDWFMTHQIEI